MSTLNQAVTALQFARDDTTDARPVVAHVRRLHESLDPVEQVLAHTTSHLDDAGFRGLHLLLHRLPGALLGRTPEETNWQSREHIEIGRCHNPFVRYNPFKLWSVLRLLRRHRVQIWHAHDQESACLGLALRRWYSMRLVVTLREAPYDARPRRGTRRCVSQYDQVLCVNEDDQLWAIGAGTPMDRCQLIAPPVDLQHFRRRRSILEAKRQLGFAPHRLLIGAFTTLADAAGVDHLIHSVHRLNRDGMPIDLLVVGSGVEYRRLQSLRTYLGRRENVRLLGERPKLQPFYEALDIYASTPTRGGVSPAIWPAQAMEVPVLATVLPGVQHFVEHEKTGLLVEPANLEEMQAAIARLAGAPEYRQKLGEAGRKALQQRGNLSDHVSTLASVYERELAAAQG